MGPEGTFPNQQLGGKLATRSGSCAVLPSVPTLDVADVKTLLLCLILVVLAPAASALVFEVYDPERHDRFLSGTWPDAPVENPAAFYSRYDLSGIGCP